MTRFYGKVGYAEDAVEDTTKPGVWHDVIVERSYSGDITRAARQLRDDSKVNNDLFFNSTISVVGDAYGMQNFSKIRYVNYMGDNWIVSDISVQDRRLNMTLGGVYNGPTP